ncbi:MAG: hypothetical protein PWP27_2228 [Clostridiales bacterium]|nr:hypothetical protein [Clostridiales bacterium]
MSKKRNKLLAIIAVVVVGAFIFTMLLPTLSAPFIDKDDNVPVALQDKENNSQQDNPKTKANNEAKYFTSSIGGNVDVGVLFLNPLVNDTDNVLFNVMLNTHSVDLTKYEELAKYVELQIDEDIIIKDGFIWEGENQNGHHISGTLKIKNDYEGAPIFDDNTKSLKLVFKNIAGVKERVHIYKGDTLR